MLKDYKEQIQDADLVLVGIGRELRADCVIDFKKAITNEHYQNLICLLYTSPSPRDA